MVEGVEFLLNFDQFGFGEVLFVGKGAYLFLRQLPLMLECLYIIFEQL